MQRDIKFRAWDKEEKKMIRSPYDSDFNICIVLPNLVEMTEKSKEAKFIRGDYLHDRFELMQYTGLKDKNGKEIYEGDIVKYKGDLSDVIAQVKFGEYEDAEGYSVGRHYGWAVFFKHFDYEGDTTLIDIHDDCEVIGNIYQNPELVK